MSDSRRAAVTSSAGEHPAEEIAWHALTAAEAAAARRTDLTSGLTGDEAARRFEQIGPNELREQVGTSALAVLLHQFTSPLIYILLIAGGVTFALREFIDAGIIMAVLALNAVIGFSQEFRAERSMEALRRISITRANVLRDGREREIDARELVPGDVVLLAAGAKVPADCRVVHAATLEVDESLITGESTPVAKREATLTADTPLPERANMLFMGAITTRGRARALVVTTGPRTELGSIAGSVQEVTKARPPLLQRMDRFAQIIGLAILAGSVVAFTSGLALGEDASDLFLTLVALAVAAIPEGLPVVLTITLAIGLNRMAARNVIIRRLAAVETLGSCSVIGSDKTGTLTENRMTVQRIVSAGKEYTVTGAGYDSSGEILLDGRPVAVESGSPLHRTLVAGVLCNDAGLVPADGGYDVVGDPTEAALLVAAAKAGLLKDELEEYWPRRAEIAFDADRRYAATFHELDGQTIVYVKGAPERVVEMCVDTEGDIEWDRRSVLETAHNMAAAGLRVLALAYRAGEPSDVETELEQQDPSGLRFLGLQGMLDPPRKETRDAVEGCREAGIRVVMITGDHAVTARAIAQQLAIGEESTAVVTGRDLDRISDDELGAVADRTPVYARVSPQHKLRIVTALQERGHVTAVTGDGVNDAPALKAADIGVAMGRSGTDVAKEASDMVVTDDNFASIFAAVEEGRIVFDNVRKVTFFLLATGLGTSIAVLASILFRFELPLLPAQLLWLNLVTNGVQDVALAFEPGEDDVLRRPPRPRREGIISPLLWERTVIAGLVLAGGTLLLFLLELHADTAIEEARTVALTTMVFFQVFHVGNSRSEHLSAFQKSPFSNRLLFVGTAVALVIHIAALYLPPTQYLLRLEPLDVWTWGKMIGVALSVIVAVEIHKLLRRPRA